MPTPSLPQPRTGPNDPGGRVTAVCVVHEILPDLGQPDTTAIDKRPCEGRLEVGPLGLLLDTQVDRKYHGGEEQALYAYAEHDAQWWAAELGRDVPPGLLGENLRTSGVDVSGAEVGERWRLGEGPDAVLVEVTSPRTPCVTLQRRLDQPRLIKRFTQAGRPGAYLRVLAGGTLGAGDAVRVESVPGHGVTVADLLSGRIEGYAALLEAERTGLLELPSKVRRHALRRTGAAARAQERAQEREGGGRAGQPA